MPIVDVSFPVRGSVIPADHGYLLFSALCSIIAPIHTVEDIGVHPIAGRLARDRSLSLTNRSHLTIRVDSRHIGNILPLAGKTLYLGDHKLRVDVPRVHPLLAAPRLYSRLVVIKGFMEPESFLNAARRQLGELKIDGRPRLVEQPHVASANIEKRSGSHSAFLRRTICIKGKEIVGFALRVEDLTAEESILLQEEGLGGRRHLGCGILIPDRR